MFLPGSICEIVDMRPLLLLVGWVWPVCTVQTRQDHEREMNNDQEA